MNFPIDNDRFIRLNETEMKQKARKLYDVELINGYSIPLDETSNCQVQNPPISSFKNIYKAFKIDRSGGKFFKWKTEELPDKISTPNIAVFFPMATGYGKSYPEPSGYLDRKSVV